MEIHFYWTVDCSEKLDKISYLTQKLLTQKISMSTRVDLHRPKLLIIQLHTLSLWKNASHTNFIHFCNVFGRHLDKSQIKSSQNYYFLFISPAFVLSEVNDEVPRCEADPYRVVVHESAHVNTPVVKVHATDMDEKAPNSDITYTIAALG